MLTLFNTFASGDWVTLALVMFVFGSVGFWFTKAAHNLAEYYRGRRDGAREERSHTNAIVIPAKLEACHKGRAAERYAILKPFRPNLTPRPKVVISTSK